MEQSLYLRAGQAGAVVLGDMGEVVGFDEEGRVRPVAVAPLSVELFGASPTNTAQENVLALTAACAWAAANSGMLLWPAGSYATDASIPLLHTVRHLGPGAIVRGGDVFHVDPSVTQTNRLYVATTGDAASDGLSAAQPMSTPQVAFSALKNYGPVLQGSWKVILAAGTYAVHSQTFEVASRDWVVVQGPDVGGHPNVPTAILDGSGFAANQHGFVVGVGGSPAGIAVWFQDIKCQDYNAGAQNSCGWSQGYAARCIFVNCHADNCDFAGILADQGDICLVKGGIISNCRDGIVLNATKGTVGYSSPFTPGSNTQITGCTEFGVYWSRGAQGHVDNCFFDQNAKALVIESAARAHVSGCDFRRSTVYAVGTNSDGSWYDDVSTPNLFNVGTANANVKPYDQAAYSGSQQGWVAASVSEMCLYQANPGSSVTSATKVQIGADLAMPNGVYAGQSGQLRPNYFTNTKTKIRIRVWGDTPNAAASFGVDFFDGTTTTSMAYSAFVGTPSAAGFRYDLEIVPLSATSQRGYVDMCGSGGSPRVESGATAANMANPQTIKLMAQSASGAMVVRRVEVWVSG